MTEGQALLLGIGAVIATNLALVLFFYCADRLARIPHHPSHQSPEATLSKARGEIGDGVHAHRNRSTEDRNHA